MSSIKNQRLLIYSVVPVAQLAERSGRKRERPTVGEFMDETLYEFWVIDLSAAVVAGGPCYAWEPIIFRGGRNPMNGYKHAPPPKGGKQNTPKDFLVEPITMKKGLTGAKPAKFCAWILDLLNFQHGEDELHDLFPGTGAMGALIFQQRQALACGADDRGGYIGHTECHAAFVPVSILPAACAALPAYIEPACEICGSPHTDSADCEPVRRKARRACAVEESASAAL